MNIKILIYTSNIIYQQFQLFSGIPLIASINLAVPELSGATLSFQNAEIRRHVGVKAYSLCLHVPAFFVIGKGYSFFSILLHFIKNCNFLPKIKNMYWQKSGDTICNMIHGTMQYLAIYHSTMTKTIYFDF